MTNLIKFAIFIIGACSLLSPTNALCPVQNCFDCNTCNKDCTKLVQDCDSDCIIQVREFLCNMEKANCIKTHGCDIPSVPIKIFPAANFDESKTAWKSKTFDARKNCCYNLSGPYQNTLSGIQNNGTCVELYDGLNCTGQSVKYDGTRGTGTEACFKFVDCPVRLAADNFKFNDKTSSFKLC